METEEVQVETVQEEVDRLSAVEAEVKKMKTLLAAKLVSITPQKLKSTSKPTQAEDVDCPIVIKDGRNMRKINHVVHNKFEICLKLVSSKMPVMLVGPAGSGKTSICKDIAQALGLQFIPITMTADSPASIFKGRRPLSEFISTPFIDCYENGGVILIDEIDSADPNVLLSINTALAGDELDLPLRYEKPVAKRHPRFFCVSAANTFGSGADRQYVGRNQLDAAFLDRFITIEVDYDPNVESTMGHAAIVEVVQGIRQHVTSQKWRRIVSSRMIQKLSILMESYPLTERVDAVEFILCSWTEAERKSINTYINASRWKHRWPSEAYIEVKDEVSTPAPVDKWIEDTFNSGEKPAKINWNKAIEDIKAKVDGGV